MTAVAWAKRRTAQLQAFIQRHPFASVYVAAVVTLNLEFWLK